MLIIDDFHSEISNSSCAGFGQYYCASLRLVLLCNCLVDPGQQLLVFNSKLSSRKEMSNKEAVVASSLCVTLGFVTSSRGLFQRSIDPLGDRGFVLVSPYSHIPIFVISPH